MRKERMKPSKVTFDSEFDERVMHDQFQVLKSSNHEYGRKAAKALEVILKENHETLEIGLGPGTLTIPLAKNVKKVVAVLVVVAGRCYMLPSSRVILIVSSTTRCIVGGKSGMSRLTKPLTIKAAAWSSLKPRLMRYSNCSFPILPTVAS